LDTRYKPAERLFHTKTKISEFIIDETQIKVISEYIWLWVAIESKTNKNILGISISKERNIFVVVAERFLSNVIKEYGEHPVSTDGDTWYPSQACSRFLKINHHLHILLWRKVSLLKGLFSIKDRTKECFDDYFPCRKKKCN
jgi:putative transposase